MASSQQSSNEISTIEKFADNVDFFIELLQDIFKDCKDSGCQIVPDILLDLGIKSIKSFTTRDLIESFIEHSNKYWVKIYQKDQDFFEKNLDTVFDGLKMQNVGLFQKLLKARDEKDELVVSNTDRENIWDILHSFVRLALKFIHEQRRPKTKVIIDLNSKKVIRKGAIYAGTYFPDIQIGKYFKLYSKDSKGNTIEEFKRKFSESVYYDTNDKKLQHEPDFSA